MSKSKIELSKESRIELLTTLRDARYLVLGDAEAFRDAASNLEHVGQILCGEIRKGLGRYKGEIVDLAVQTKRHSPGEVGRLFNVVLEARNKAVHTGSFARHLSSRLIDLMLILEEAIMSQMQEIQDLMVRSPMVAEPWQMIAHVRNAMLASSFSNLPFWQASDSRWMILTDTVVMKMIHGVEGEDRKVRLSMTIETALAKGLIMQEPASCVPPDEPVKEVLNRMTHLPILITEPEDKRDRLLGIITPFDLL